MRKHAHDRHVAWFIDPPYTAGRNGKRAGRRLYVHNELDHEELFRVTTTLAGDFLMTYDDAEEVRALAVNQGVDFTLCAMQNTHLRKMKELLMGRNMDWAR
jgi:DNA adenine methylase